MGAAFNGFSIRDYTNKMRSVDVFKCWPFSTSPNVTSKDLNQWLPPMTLPSSSSSSSSFNQQQSLTSTSTTNHHQQQQSLKSHHQSSTPSPPSPPPAADEDRLVCPVCREFNAATLTAVNAHIDACLAQTVREDRRQMRIATITTSCAATATTSFKSSSSLHVKPKAPKKRSIAEIFKVKEPEKEHPEQEKEKELELEKEQEKENEKEEEEEEEENEEPRIESVLKLWKKDGVEDEDSVVDDVSITVTKFQWLSQRLEALRSGRRGGQSAKSDAGGASGTPAEAMDNDEEEKSEMVCPVCRDFNAATVTAVNAHIDNCLAQAVRDERRQMRKTAGVSGGGFKHKPKAPKKRSIAEILTVAPPIGATKSKAIEVAKDYDEEEEDNEDEDKSSDYSGLNSAGAAAADADCDGIVVSTTKNKKSTTTTKGRKKKMKKKKTKEAKKKSKAENLSCEKTTTVSKQLKKKKKKKKKSFLNTEVTTTSSKKEDACKRKVQTLANSFRQLKATVGTKMLALHSIDPPIHERKLDSKISFVEKEQKVKAYEPDAKQPKSVSPFGGILKKHVKQVSGKASSSSSAQDGTDEYSCDDEYPTSDRYVRFTCKDDIPGPKRRNSFEENMFNKSSDELTTSFVKVQSSGSDRETASLGANRNYDYTAININRKEFCPIVESKEFASTLEQTTVQNFLKPCPSQKKSMLSDEKSQTLTKVMLCDDNNLHPFDGGNTTTLHCSPYDDIPSPLSTDQEVKMSGTNSQLCESGSLSSIGRFIDHLEDSTFRAVHLNSDANTRTFLEPSSSYSSSYDKGNERPEFPLQTYEDNDDSSQAFGDRQFSHMLSSDMIDNTFLYTAWGKGSIRNNCLDPSFYGLPLNSHGELINFSSSGTVGTNQPETSSTLRGSLSGLPGNNTLHQDTRENLRINERQDVQKISPKDGLNSFPHYPARLAVTELPCDRDINPADSEMCSSSFVQPSNSEVNITRNLPIEQNQYGQVQSHKGHGMISVKESSDHVTLSSSQPTMRLMGKDVPIGSSSSKAMQQLAVDVWAGEESGRRHYSEYGALENSFLEKCSKQDWVSGTSSSADNVVQSPKIQSSQALRSAVLINGHDTEFPPQFADMQSNHVSQNGSLRVSRNGSSYFHPITQEPALPAMFNGAPDDFPERFMPGVKPQGFRSHSQVQATPCNFSPPTCSNNRELHGRNKTPHHAAKPAFEFPFLQTSNNEQAKSSCWSQKPYRSLPSWLSGPTDERLPVTFSHQFSGASSQSFSQCIWGNKFTPPSASSNHSAQVLYPSNPLTYPGPIKTNHLSPASTAQPPHVPITSSTLNTGCRNMNMVEDTVNLDHNIAKDYHPCTNTRKRPASSALDDSRKPIKLPNIEVQENSSPEVERTMRVAKLDPRLDGARGRCCQNEAQKLNTKSYPAVDSFKLDGTVTGPVRLGPRAKHILRSS